MEKQIKLKISTFYLKIIIMSLMILSMFFMFGCDEENVEHVHEYVDVSATATCEADGYVGVKCTTCNNLIVNNILEKLNHEYIPYEKMATCEEKGFKGVKCENCDDIVIETTLEKIEHEYIHYEKSATCEENGYVVDICDNCGNKQNVEKIDKLNHNYKLISLVLDHSNINNCGNFKCENCYEEIYKTINCEDVGMPILSFNGSMEGISKENKINISVNYESSEISFSSDATLKWQGASSLNYDKKNYNITFLKTGTTSKNKVELVEEWGKQSKYTLKANWIDFSHARNVVSGKIYSQVVKSRDLEDEVSKLHNGGVVDGFPILIYHNGNFEGLYTLNIPKDNWMFGMEDDEGDGTIKHAALSTGSWEAEAILTKEVEEFSDTIELEFCSTEDTVGVDWVLDSFNNMIRFINNSTDEDFKTNISKYVNIERTIDSLIYTSAILAEDNIAKNMIWLTYDGVHWFSSVYDMDGTWGLKFHGQSYNPAEMTIVSETQGNLLWIRLYRLFKTEIAKRYFELRTSVLTIGNIENQFKTFDNKISQIVRSAETSKWSGLPSVDTNNVAQIINFAEKRFEYLDELMLSYL